jgi:adenylate kinase
MKSLLNIVLLGVVIILPSAVGFVVTTLPPRQSHPIQRQQQQQRRRRLSTQDSTRLFAKAYKIIIAGAPASGKGTQCEFIKEKFGVVHLSTGDMLRAAVAAQTEVGKQAKDYMDSGKLVPDEVIIGVVRIHIQGWMH